jgi:hypothetical protein
VLSRTSIARATIGNAKQKLVQILFTFGGAPTILFQPIPTA